MEFVITILLALMAGFAIGSFVCAAAQTATERESVKRGIVVLDGNYYVISKLERTDVE